MRLLTFTLLAIAAGIGVQWGFTLLPHAWANAMHGIGMDIAWFLLLPMVATAALARAMCISHLGYVLALTFFSPLIAFISVICFSLFVLNDPLL